MAAAEAVCADEALEAWEILDVLSRLADRSLVLVEEGEARYRLLEPLRQYAQEKLAEAADDRRRASRPCPLLYGVCGRSGAASDRAEQAEWLGRLDDDYGNRRAALAWPSRCPRAWSRACAWPPPCSDELPMRGYDREGYDWLQKLLPR